MLAYVLEENGPILKEIARPEPLADEALIRVRLAGICATDLELIRGYMNFRGVLGHEFVGEVAGPEAHPLLGRRVVGEINCGCGNCPWCARGMERHCLKRSVLGILGRSGAFAEFTCLPSRNLHVLPDSVQDEAAVFCEPLAACFEVIEQFPEIVEREVLVIGDGRLGLLQTQVLYFHGARVSLLGRHPEKMALLAPLKIPTWSEPAQAVCSEGERWPVVVEATGSADGFALAVSKTKPRGVLVLKSTVASEARLNLSSVVVDEITVLGSRCGLFEPAIRALEAGEVRTFSMIHGSFALRDAPEAFDKAHEKGIIKVLIHI
ncbi:MAG: alcohol dehydrogenase catalytic domain-containing protein [Nitrospinae bacterium]|nr:alcohol dehydrogenase catalytic domain-containing protein [Nitrospinota bacterium]